MTNRVDQEQGKNLVTMVAPSFIDELTELVQAMVNESGAPANFDARLWVNEWLSTPSHALGWRNPIEFTATEDGRELLKTLLQRMQSGAYS